MKRQLIRLTIALLLALCVCAGALAETDDSGEDEAWHISVTSEITAEVRAAFDKAVEGLEDAVYEPIALLGESAGVYCILCQVTGKEPGAEPSCVLLYIGEDGIQNTWELWIDKHSTPAPEKPAEPEEPVVDYGVLLSDLAAAQQALDAVRSDLEAMKEDALAAFIAEKWEEIYLDPGYRLYIDDRDDPAKLPISGKHAFVVLGYQLQDGEMTDELKARCGAAANAAAAFPESILVCTGGATGENNPEEHTEAGLMKAYLTENCGIAGDRIFTDESAMTTLDNAVNTFAILKAQGIEEITIVTSSYHQRRANILYETLAEIVRRTEGLSISLAGNYSCEIKAPEQLAKYDARIAAGQLEEMLTTLLNTEDN
ncbi:MAG: YdcF family protein [Clostridia bacterium]|nr:YdcF family protein [Clostridia bacterium]